MTDLSKLREITKKYTNTLIYEMAKYGSILKEDYPSLSSKIKDFFLDYINNKSFTEEQINQAFNLSKTMAMQDIYEMAKIGTIHKKDFPNLYLKEFKKYFDINLSEFKPQKINSPKKLKIFVSYSIKDKRIAGAIKDSFNEYNIDTFLAHEDIEIGKEWRDIILANLNQFDVFIALLSKNFIESEWTNQEAGFAVCRNKLIISISIDDKMPYGFLEMFQALTKLKCREYNKSLHSEEKVLDCSETVFEIIKIMLSIPELKENIKSNLIKNMKYVPTFDSAKEHLDLLISLKPFDKEQINEIILQSINNSQFHYSRKCIPVLKELIKEHESFIEIDNKNRIEELIKP